MSDTQHINEALKQFADKGVVKIFVEFSGGGDAGQIDGITYFKESEEFDISVLVNATSDFHAKMKWNSETKRHEVVEKAKYELEPIKYTHRIQIWDPNTGVYKISRVEEKECLPEEYIENYVYEALDKTGVDWYNNEGGFGEYDFLYNKEKKAWTFKCEVHQYHTESSLEHEGEGNL